MIEEIDVLAEKYRLGARYRLGLRQLLEPRIHRRTIGTAIRRKKLNQNGHRSGPSFGRQRRLGNADAGQNRKKNKNPHH